jgi:hypothetical protein
MLVARRREVLLGMGSLRSEMLYQQQAQGPDPVVEKEESSLAE